jgi:hypothetical protein
MTVWASLEATCVGIFRRHIGIFCALFVPKSKICRHALPPRREGSGELIAKLRNDLQRNGGTILENMTIEDFDRGFRMLLQKKTKEQRWKLCKKSNGSRWLTYSSFELVEQMKDAEGERRLSRVFVAHRSTKEILGVSTDVQQLFSRACVLSGLDYT